MRDFHYPIAVLQTSIEHGDLPMNAFAWLVYPSTLEDAWMRTLWPTHELCFCL